jgi:hypothetical protein
MPEKVTKPSAPEPGGARAPRPADRLGQKQPSHAGLELSAELLVARLLVAIDELKAAHPWWCKQGDSCQCGLKKLLAVRGEIRANVASTAVEPFAALAPPMTRPTVEHVFEPVDGNPYCGICVGGEHHPVHKPGEGAKP